jgi:ribosome biogenesis GTPase / thiamine phosphate phosphatase
VSRLGLVLAREGSRFRVATPEGEVLAILRGKARRDAYDRVVVGDRVQLDDREGGVLLGITGVEPRRNLLERRSPLGRGNRPVAANLDRVFVVTASVDPEPVPQLIDRLSAIAEANDIPVSLVVTKIDLDPGAELAARYRQAGYEVYQVSTRTGAGLERLFAELRGKESLLTGASGVGKSTLLNRLQPGLVLPTREISNRSRRGRNTTVAAVLVPLAGEQGGWLVDTPGFSEVGLWGIAPRELARCFPEMRERLERCRFADCWHRSEPGCAVREAVGGAIHPGRYASYRVLLDELEQAPDDWE